MATLLLPSSPIYGHLVPMLAVARALVDRGHDVTVLTGTKYRLTTTTPTSTPGCPAVTSTAGWRQFATTSSACSSVRSAPSTKP
jgi:hypothetical protein